MERRECQEKKVSKKEMPKAKDAKRQRRQRKAPETTASRDSNDVRKSLSGGKSVSSLWLQSCRQEGLSRFRNARSKPDQEKVAASNKDVESKKCQGQRFQRDHAVDGRASQAVSCSYRVSLVFTLETSVTRLARALLVYLVYIYMIIYVYNFQTLQTAKGSFPWLFLLHVLQNC